MSGQVSPAQLQVQAGTPQGLEVQGTYCVPCLETCSLPAVNTNRNGNPHWHRPPMH